MLGQKNEEYNRKVLQHCYRWRILIVGGGSFQRTLSYIVGQSSFDSIQLQHGIQVVPTSSFLKSQNPGTGKDVARSFLREMFRWHGPPDAIVSDRDPKFRSAFWEGKRSLWDLKFKISTHHHPHTDGLSEVMAILVET